MVEGMLKKTALQAVVITILFMLPGGLLGFFIFDNILIGIYLAGMVLYIVLIIWIWYPKIKVGGFFGGHDAEFPGPKQALGEIFTSYQLVGDCWLIRKTQ